MNKTIKGEWLNFFIGSFLGAVFAFDNENRPIAIAGSAGESDDGMRRCSASIYKDNDYATNFNVQPRHEWRGFSK